MASLSTDTILQCLRQVIDPQDGRDVVSAGRISGIALRGGRVGFQITVTPQEAASKEPLRKACEAAVRALAGVEHVTAVLTAEASAPSAPPEAKKAAVWNRMPVEGVKRIIAIASGKGGVGKSTTTINLALALTAQGKRIGLLDADIYGPSLPRMLGLANLQPAIADGKMQPPRAHHMPAMSMGFVSGDQAAVLRGPMISKTLNQLLRFTHWAAADAPLDMLLVDMPPGTGDIHLSLAQQVPLDGAIIVTTPQDIAVIDARKCLQMFEKLGVAVLGVVENMSAFIDAQGQRVALFGAGGGQKLAQETGVPFLGSVPLDPAIGASAEKGEDFIHLHAASNAAGMYRSIAEAIL